MQWNIIFALLWEITVVLSTLHIKQFPIHMWRRRESHCGSSISCLNGGRSCTCICMYNNVPNDWFFYLVWVYTFELGLPLFARLCPQNHTPKIVPPHYTPKAILPKPDTQSQTIHPTPYAQSHTSKAIRPKPYYQNYTPKTIPPKLYS